MKFNESDDLPEHPDALRKPVLQLLREQEEKDAEHARQIAEHTYNYQHILRQKEQHIAIRDETIARLEMTIAKLERWRFGRRSEKLSPNQISLWEEALETEIAAVESELEAVLAESAATKSSITKVTRRHPGRMQLSDTLPRVEVQHHPEQCTCDQCGGPLEIVGEAITEKLDYVPGHFRVIRHVRPKMACRPCGTLESPALPAQVIDKGLPTARTIAQVMTAKYLDHSVLRTRPLLLRWKRCFTKDEGRPLEVGLQEQASNHHKLRELRALVVSVAGYGGARLRQVRIKETNASEPPMTCRNVHYRRRNREVWLSRDKVGGSLITAQLASGMKAA